MGEPPIPLDPRDRNSVVANFRNRGHYTNDHREKKKKRKTNKYLEERDSSDSSDSSSSDESDEESYEAKRHRHRKKKSRKKKKHNKRKRDNGRAKGKKNRKWMKNAKCHHSITSESGYNGDSSPVVSSSSMQYDENLVDNSQVHHEIMNVMILLTIGRQLL